MVYGWLYFVLSFIKWYNNIIANAIMNPKIDGYTETHHIIPKSLGGTNDETNLVKLSAREHFLCHWLLVKMTSGSSQIKMSFAFNSFRRSSKNQQRSLTSRQYSIVRKVVSTARSRFLQGNTYNLGKKRKPLSDEHKKKISDAKKGRVMSEENKLKISLSLKGKPKSQSTKEKMRKPKSASHAENIRLANVGKRLSEETKKKISLSRQRSKHIRPTDADPKIPDHF